jgi:hypothetical protein
MTLWMITGNATDDGAPIYLQTNGRWTRRLAEGLAITCEEQRDRLLGEAKAAERIVCDPYVIDVRQTSRGQLQGASLRERIRAEGPTVSSGGHGGGDGRKAAGGAGGETRKTVSLVGAAPVRRAAASA